MVPDSQRLAEWRSLELHRLVADRLREEPALLDVARWRVANWLDSRPPSRYYLLQWQEILNLPLENVLAILVEDSERARDLRASSPFAGVVSPRDRWRLWKSAFPDPGAGTRS